MEYALKVETATRRDLRIRAALTVRLASRGHPLLGVTRNIGLGGFFLLTDKRLRNGRVLAVEIDGGAAVVEMRARVVHVEPQGVGCRFERPAEKSEDGLMDLLDTLLVHDGCIDDRRRWLRHRCAAAITWREGTMDGSGTLADLSPHGASVRGRCASVVGVELELRLPDPCASPSARAPECRARVVHRDAGLFGVEFIAPSADFLSAVWCLLRGTGDAAPPT